MDEIFKWLLLRGTFSIDWLLSMSMGRGHGGGQGGSRLARDTERSPRCSSKSGNMRIMYFQNDMQCQWAFIRIIIIIVTRFNDAKHNCGQLQIKHLIFIFIHWNNETFTVLQWNSSISLTIRFHLRQSHAIYARIRFASIEMLYDLGFWLAELHRDTRTGALLCFMGFNVISRYMFCVWYTSIYAIQSPRRPYNKNNNNNKWIIFIFDIFACGIS